MRRRQIRFCIALFLASALPSALHAQTPAQPEPAPTTNPLPDEPHPAGTLSGLVTDADGDVIIGARITLGETPTPRTQLSDQDGHFRFDGVAPGNLKLTFAAPGFAPVVQLVTLQPRQQLELAPTPLTVATETDVDVVLSQHDVAQIEMHEEEKQRLLGVLPNFFVTYDWHAPPLSTRQKYELAWKTTIDPVTFLVAGGIAGVQQSQNDFSGYGQGAAGYGKRYGAALADGAIGNMLSGAVLPSLLHQDPRYFYKGTGTIRSRAFYAVAAAVICRGDNGRWQPNYSSVLGDFAAGAISNAYYPASDRNGAGLTIENGVLDVVGDAVNNLIEEFVFRKITTNTHHQAASQTAQPATRPAPATP